MGKKSKRGKGGKKGKGSKKGKSKGKKKEKKEVTKVIPPPPPPDVFFWVRRKTASLLVEAYDEMPISELKLIVSTVFGYVPEDIQLFRSGEEMIEKKEKKRDKEKDKKEKEEALKKERERPKKGKKPLKDKKPEKKPDPLKDKANEADKWQIFTVGDYGLNAKTSSLFSPASVGLVFRDPIVGNFESMEISAYTKPVPIPEIVKPYLRNYQLLENTMKADEESILEVSTSKKKKGSKNRRGNNSKKKA